VELRAPHDKPFRVFPCLSVVPKFKRTNAIVKSQPAANGLSF
jgi:hypothetical protein